MPSNPNENLISLDIPTKDLSDIDAALTTLETKLLPHLVSLTIEQRSNLFKMGSRESLVRHAVTAAEQNADELPASVGTDEAQADLTSLDTYRPYFSRVAKLNEAVADTEMAIGIDLMNFTLRVYALLKVSAPDALKGLLQEMSGFFGGGRRAKPALAAAGK